MCIGSILDDDLELLSAAIWSNTDPFDAGMTGDTGDSLLSKMSAISTH